MTQSQFEIWFIIIALGVFTYLIRFSFLGIIGDREIPDLLRRALRYVGVAILPAIATPLVIWPESMAGQLDPVRIGAGILTLTVGIYYKNAFFAILAGFTSFYLLSYFFH